MITEAEELRNKQPIELDQASLIMSRHEPNSCMIQENVPSHNFLARHKKSQSKCVLALHAFT